MSTHHDSTIENDVLTETLIANICAQLSSHNWSLKMLADYSELPYESIKKLINHKISRPSFYSIWKISSAFGCSIDRLAGREDPSAAALQQISENASEIFRLLADIDTPTQKCPG